LLGKGDFESPAGPGADDVRDRLGLAEIDPVVQKRPLREFARLGQARAGMDNLGQGRLEDQRVPVAVNFQDVLAGVGLRLFHEGGEDFVENPARSGGNDAAVAKAVGFQGEAGPCGPEEP